MFVFFFQEASETLIQRKAHLKSQITADSNKVSISYLMRLFGISIKLIKKTSKMQTELIYVQSVMLPVIYILYLDIVFESEIVS